AAAQLGKAFAATAKQVKPAVVYIETWSLTTVAFVDPFELFNDEFARRFFGQHLRRRQQQQMSKAMGSGFLVSADGNIVTNAHVVKDAKQIMVKLADGRELKAQVAGVDEKNDVAVIRVPEKGLPFLEFGDSDNLEVGEWVLAVGNPFGLAQTVTSGIVSAKERNSMGISDYEDFIQTDAAINPGNSGGPLVNLEGQVVGLNTAIFSKSGGYMGIGFAIPSNAVRQIVHQLRAHGEFVPGFFGAVVTERADRQGVLVEQVMRGSPAQAAGLKIGDVIVSINGRGVDDSRTFNNLIGMAGEDAELAIVYRREGVEKRCRARLQAPAKPRAFTDETLGVEVRELSPRDYTENRLPMIKGVLVEAASPTALAIGLVPGTVIVEVNGRKVENLALYAQAVAAASRRGILNLLLFKAGRFGRTAVRLR
ncbi:MAG: trypsin-like peptidase domain-containing protein, partial [Planctomycetes bacterium]|nr:trypsin-like peptidase domain-containing protein [Planctomycetota bacterium]